MTIFIAVSVLRKPCHRLCSGSPPLRPSAEKTFCLASTSRDVTHLPVCVRSIEWADVVIVEPTVARHETETPAQQATVSRALRITK
jgi:hypothetical protein